MSMRLLPAMGYDGYRLRSKPLVIEDATLQLQGISAMGDQVEPADVVKEVNKITGTNLKVSDQAPTLGVKLQQQQQQIMMNHQLGLAQAGAASMNNASGPVKPINPSPKSPIGPPMIGGPTPLGGNPGAPRPRPVPNVMGGAGKPMGMGGGMQKSDEPIVIPDLAIRAMTALRKRDLGELLMVLPIIGGLDDGQRLEHDAYTTQLTFIDPSYDPMGTRRAPPPAPCTSWRTTTRTEGETDILQFDRLRKEELLKEGEGLKDPIAALVKAERESASDGRHADGKFKLGPVNSQHKNGDQAFEMARGHLDEAQKSAKIGDVHAANFHIGMAQQYANVGTQNHMMGDYLKQSQGKPNLMPAPDMSGAGGQGGGGQGGGQRGGGQRGY